MATHNMLEAEALPDRLVILEEGRIVAAWTPQKIKERAGAQALAVLTLASDAPPPELFGPEARVLREDKRCLVTVPMPLLPRALILAQVQGLRIENVQAKEFSLWDAFLRLTGRPHGGDGGGRFRNGFPDAALLLGHPRGAGLEHACFERLRHRSHGGLAHPL